MSMLFLGMWYMEPEDNNIETGGRVFFLGVGVKCRKTMFLLKYSVRGCLKISDLAIILSKIVRKCYQSFTFPFEHKEFHILKQTEFNCVAVT